MRSSGCGLRGQHGNSISPQSTDRANAVHFSHGADGPHQRVNLAAESGDQAVGDNSFVAVLCEPKGKCLVDLANPRASANNANSRRVCTPNFSKILDR